MILGPGLDTVITRNGEGMLPKVEEELPVLGIRERTVLHFHRNCEINFAATLRNSRDRTLVFARFRVCRNIHSEPKRTVAVCRHINTLGCIKAVTNQFLAANDLSLVIYL